MDNDEIPITKMGRDKLIEELLHLRVENAKLRERHKEIAGWRPEVGWFATAMEAKLRQNDFKGHWRSERATDMLARAQEELDELRALTPYLGPAQSRQHGHGDDVTQRHARALEILGEAADVGAIVMMVADLCARGMRL